MSNVSDEDASVPAAADEPAIRADERARCVAVVEALRLEMRYPPQRTAMEHASFAIRSLSSPVAPVPAVTDEQSLTPLLDAAIREDQRRAVPAVTADEAALAVIAKYLHRLSMEDPDGLKCDEDCARDTGALYDALAIVTALRSAGFLIVHHTKET